MGEVYVEWRVPEMRRMVGEAGIAVLQINSVHCGPNTIEIDQCLYNCSEMDSVAHLIMIMILLPQYF